MPQPMSHRGEPPGPNVLGPGRRRPSSSSSHERHALAALQDVKQSVRPPRLAVYAQHVSLAPSPSPPFLPWVHNRIYFFRGTMCNRNSTLNSAGSRVASTTVTHRRCADNGRGRPRPVAPQERRHHVCAAPLALRLGRKSSRARTRAAFIWISGAPARSVVCPPVATPVSASRSESD